MRHPSTVLSRPPWIPLLLFVVVFFVGAQQWRYSEGAQATAFSQTSQQLEEFADDGNVSRRLVIGLWCAYAVFLLWPFRFSRITPRGLTSWMILLFVGFTIASLCWSDEPSMSARRIAVFAIHWLAALAILRRYGPSILTSLAIGATGTYLLFGVASELVVGSFVPWRAEYRFAGTMHPNAQGLNCAVLLIACAFAAHRFPRARNSLVLAALVAAVFLVLTKSRTALGITVVVLCIQQFRLSHRYRMLFLTVPALLVVVVATLVVATPELSTSLLFLGRASETGADLTGRLPLWNSLLPFVYERPLLGFGFGAFWDPARILRIASENDWVVSQAHSLYLELALAGGLAGLVLFTVAAIAAAIRAWTPKASLPDQQHLLVFSLILFSILVGITESAVLWQGPITFFLNLSMLCSASSATVVKHPYSFAAAPFHSE